MTLQRQLSVVCSTLSLLFWSGTIFLWSRQLPPSVQSSVIGEIPVVSKEQIFEFKSKKEEIPERVNLDIPFTSQAPEKNWDQPWQDACEEAAVLMLDAYVKGYGLSPIFARDEILKMVAWQDARGWGHSISAGQIRQFLDEYSGIQTQMIENPTVEDIKKFIVEGKSVYTVADGKALPNPYFRNGGPVYHALIIRGYTEDSFITNDPGTRYGENFVYQYDDLLNAIHDWNDGDVKTGKKVILVLE